MVTESEFEKAAVEFHLAVNAARQARVEVDEARWALEDMQCLKEFQCVIGDAEGIDFAFVLTLCGYRKGHAGPHGEGPMSCEYEAAVMLDEAHTIPKDTGWVREMGRKARALFGVKSQTMADLGTQPD